jgi:hypothetical protein
VAGTLLQVGLGHALDDDLGDVDLGDLDDAGYDVQIQYENGTPDSPLSQCTVTDINTVGSAGNQPLAYMTVNCPK